MGFQHGTLRGSRVARSVSFGKPEKMHNVPFKRDRAGTESDIDWSRGNCKKKDPDTLFVRGAAQNTAKRICKGCPIQMECLATALDNREEGGVWGGYTERERRALLRRHPQVPSWRTLFNRAKQQNIAA